MYVSVFYFFSFPFIFQIGEGNYSDCWFLNFGAKCTWTSGVVGLVFRGSLMWFPSVAIFVGPAISVTL